MAKRDEHPTVIAARAREAKVPAGPVGADELRAICLECGADDVGFVAIDRSELETERAEILRLFPATRTAIALICRMNPDSVRSPARNVSNQEFHSTGDEVNEAAREIVRRLREMGIRAVNPPMAFPMEMDRFGGKMWSISLKPLAVAAGLGQIGIHRNLIHPKFGNFVLIGVVLAECEVTEQARPIDFNPCLECKLCVAACPVGAIRPDGGFDFSACYAHNYREFMGGFSDWAESIAQSRDAIDYRSRFSDSETASMWQSLSFGANYKAAYCLAVCPAGEDVIGPFLENAGKFKQETLKPLQVKEETVYVQVNSDAETYVARRFPHKRVRRVGAVLRPTSIQGFVSQMRHAFQPGKSKGLSARYHFRFTGEEPISCTVTIRDGTIEVEDGLAGDRDLLIQADSKNWLAFLRKEKSIAKLLITRRVRLKGDPRLLVAFGRCFP
ncbi:4Fe-4S ferredoxin [bacterium]|nr:4Fe-4S ferredoxin [bacterium]